MPTDELIVSPTDPRRAAHAVAIQSLQNTLGQFQSQYADSTLAFVALHAAWEAIRVAWYAVRYEQAAHLADLTEAVARLTETGEESAE